MTEAEQKAAAKKFAADWKGKGDEKSDTQKEKEMKDDVEPQL